MTGCRSWFASSGLAEPVVTRIQTGAQLSSRRVEKRPSLAVVEREGDPAGAVSLALAVAGGCLPTASLGALVGARLSTARVAAHVDAQPGGLSITILLPDAETARLSLRELDRALRAPVSPQESRDPTLFALAAPLLEELSRFEGVWSPREDCRETATGGPAGVESRLGRYRAVAETTRRATMVRERAHFGLAGPHEIVSKATETLLSLPEWPGGERTDESLIARNQFVHQASSNDQTRASLLWTTVSYPQALSAAESLRHPSSALAGQLRTLPGHYRVESAAGIPLPVGGLLQVELGGTTSDEASEPSEQRRMLTILLDESRRRLATPLEPNLLARNVLSQTDPRDTARLAAWSLLSADAPTPSNRVVVTLTTSAEASSVGGLATVVDENAIRSPSHLEQVVRLERGQGGLWALLGSVCGTLDETRANAGATAIVLQTLASRYSGTDSVELEAWTSPEGVGLLAHAQAGANDRSDLELAHRIGNVLGMVMATGVISHADSLRSRDDLLSLLGQGPRPALWLALDALSPGRPGSLVSNGTFESLSHVQPSTLEQRRLHLLRHPLRLAVLANTRVEQASTVNAAIGRWIAVHTEPNSTCPAVVPDSPRSTVLRLEGARPDPSDAQITITVELHDLGATDTTLASWVAWLVTREGGWLERALVDASLAGRVEGALVGGAARRGLVLLVGSTPDNADATVRQAQGLFRHLASSYTIGQSEYLLAKKWFDKEQTERGLSPRHRLVTAWSNQSHPAAPPTLTELQQYLGRALSTAAFAAVVRQPDP
jgi:hypothetical protein